MIQARRRREAHSSSEPPNFWASYSDLMASMLMVFILLLVVALFHFSENTERQKSKMASFAALQEKLIENLAKTFEKEQVQVDPHTGVLQIGTGILFGEGEDTLQPEGKQQLHALFNAYVAVILDDEFRDFVKQIEIEGHTNTNGTYLFNLELSQKRALAVMKELMGASRSPEQKQRLEKLVVASGRGYAQLIRDASGKEDPVRSRRIEIKFRLKEGELFQEIYKDLVR